MQAMRTVDPLQAGHTGTCSSKLVRIGGNAHGFSCWGPHIRSILRGVRFRGWRSSRHLLVTLKLILNVHIWVIGRDPGIEN